jgi:hypothetical protein
VSLLEQLATDLRRQQSLRRLWPGSASVDVLDRSRPLASDRPPSLCREYPKLHKASFVSEILKDLRAASPTLKLDPLLHHIVRKDIGTGGAG